MTNFNFYDIIKSPNKDEVLKMKLATNKWNVRIIINGKAEVPFYYGFKTKREAQSEADRWISKGFEAKVIINEVRYNGMDDKKTKRRF